ncbi:MAG: serine/threonine-protein kinase, partial [Myxococcota bacterium]
AAGSYAHRQPYLVIEHVPGISLREELALRSEAGRPPTPMMVVALFGQLTTALSAAHDRGIVHRDLKPANIMFSAKGKEVVVKLLDFGVAKVTETSQPMTTKGRLIGSYAYMAPEQVDARSPVGPASDVFALGTLIYEVAGLHRAWLRDDDDQPLPFHSPAGLSSRNAPPALVRRILQGELPARRPEVDLVWDLLEAAWSGEPSQRPSVAEMRRELRTRLGDDDADDEAAELTRAAHLVALERRRGSTLANPALAARVPSADEPWALEETFGASAEATPFGASPDSARRRAWASRLLWGALIGGGVFLLGLVAGGLFS